MPLQAPGPDVRLCARTARSSVAFFVVLRVSPAGQTFHTLPLPRPSRACRAFCSLFSVLCSLFSGAAKAAPWSFVSAPQGKPSTHSHCPARRALVARSVLCSLFSVLCSPGRQKPPLGPSCQPRRANLPHPPIAPPVAPQGRSNQLIS